MTLEQFANLMEGLGYKGVRGEREKPASSMAPKSDDDAPSDEPANPIPEEASATETEAAEATSEEDRIEVFYTFTWAGNRGGQQRGKPEGKQGGRPKGKGKPRRDGGGGGGKQRNFESRPPKKDRIDPDNPFAQALMGLKTKDK